MLEKNIGGVSLPKPDFAGITQFNKNFYLESPELMLLDPDEVIQIKNEKQIYT